MDGKSSVCPIFVITLSKVCPMAAKVKSLSNQIRGLSKVCRVPVQISATWTQIGHGNPTFVKTLSNKKNRRCRFSLLTRAGQTLDLDNLLPNLVHGQSLDKLYVWTNLGQCVKWALAHCPPSAQSLPRTWTNSRQNLHMDKPWTMFELCCKP